MSTGEETKLAETAPREIRVMTDFVLAHELGETLTVVMGLLPVPATGMNPHAERITRAIRFLRGDRPKTSAALSDDELRLLLRNDPAVNAIFDAARALAHSEIAAAEHRARTVEEMASIGGVPTSIPEDGQVPEGVTVVPDLCERCKSHAVHKSLMAKLEDPWRAWLVMVQMLLFQVMQEDAEAETIGGAQDLQGKLLAIGCLGCRYPRALHQAGLLIRSRGAEFVGRVIKGEAKAISFDVKQLARRRQ